MLHRKSGAAAVVAIVLGCAPMVLPTEQDWMTSYRGAGNVPCRVVNDSEVPITLRFEDFHQHIDAQIKLEPHRAELIYLPPGPVRAKVRVERDGQPFVSEGKQYTVPADTIGVDWHFFPPER